MSVSGDSSPRAAPRARISGRSGDKGGVSTDPPVFTPGEIWGVAPDGAVARVLPEPYRVMWYGKDSVTVGEVQPYSPIPVTEADRQAHYENEKGMRPVVVSISGGAVTSIGEGQPVRDPGRREFAATEMVCIPENVFEDGEWAILEWRDPKGLRGCGFFHVVDGLIQFQRGYWDQLSFLRLQGRPLPTA